MVSLGGEKRNSHRQPPNAETRFSRLVTRSLRKLIWSISGSVAIVGTVEPKVAAAKEFNELDQSAARELEPKVSVAKLLLLIALIIAAEPNVFAARPPLSMKAASMAADPKDSATREVLALQIGETQSVPLSTL